MATKTGVRCSRNAAPAGFGFCWQHAPVRDELQREVWKQRLEEAKLVVTGAAVLTQLVEVALKLLTGISGASEEARREFRERYDIRERKNIAVVLSNPAPPAEMVYKAEHEFDLWFASLPDFMQQNLLTLVAARVHKSAIKDGT